MNCRRASRIDSDEVAIGRSGYDNALPLIELIYISSPPSGRSSTYRSVQVSGTSSVHLIANDLNACSAVAIATAIRGVSWSPTERP